MKTRIITRTLAAIAIVALLFMLVVAIVFGMLAISANQLRMQEAPLETTSTSIPSPPPVQLP